MFGWRRSRCSPTSLARLCCSLADSEEAFSVLTATSVWPRHVHL